MRLQSASDDNAVKWFCSGCVVQNHHFGWTPSFLLEASHFGGPLAAGCVGGNISSSSCKPSYFTLRITAIHPNFYHPFQQTETLPTPNCPSCL